MRAERRCRLAVLASHPIQYFTPIYKRLAERPDISLDVLFCSDYGVRPRFDKQFGQKVRWDTDQLSGYRSRFLTNVSPITDTFNPFHAINPGAFTGLLRSYDAVWVNGYTYPSNWLAAAAAHLRSTPLLFRSELRISDDQVTGAKRYVRDAIVRWWVRRSAALLYIGEANREAYLRYGARPDQLFFCPYSVDVERIDATSREYADAKQASLRQEWCLPVDRPVILFVGKLIARKHAEALLDIAAAVGPSGHVALAGSGPMEPELRRRVAEDNLSNVTFFGFVNQSRLPEVYAMADVFIMASEREPWGLVLNEAMAAGVVPIVTEDVGANPDLIAEGETGYVVASGDTSLMIARVLTLLGDEGLRHRISAAARRRSLAYSYEASTEGIVSALRGVGALRAEQVGSGVSDAPNGRN